MSQIYAIEITGYLKSGKINTKNASRQVTYENILEMHCQTSLKLYTEEQIITETTLSFDVQRKAERVVDEEIEPDRVTERYIINTRGTCYLSQHIFVVVNRVCEYLFNIL